MEAHARFVLFRWSGIPAGTILYLKVRTKVLKENVILYEKNFKLKEEQL